MDGTHLAHDGPRRVEVDTDQLHPVVVGNRHPHPHSVHVKTLGTGLVLGDIPETIIILIMVS